MHSVRDSTNMLFSSSSTLPMYLLMTSLLVMGLEAAATAGTTPGCASCRMPLMEKDAEQRLLVEIAKQQILNNLHLKERPNITSTVPRAALLTALRKLHAGRVRSDGTFELENKIKETKDPGYEIVSFAEIDEMNTTTGAQPGLTFQFLQEREHSIQVLQSALWLYVHSSDTPNRGPRPTATAHIYLSSPGEGRSNHTLLLEKILDVQKSNWHTFPITHTLQAFMDGSKRLLQLEVICKEAGFEPGQGQNLCELGKTMDMAHQPFVVAQVRLRDNSRHILQKRSLRCGDNVSVCCKKDFYVKFKDIQWQDWIIAPEGYHMNHCMGQCPQALAGSPGIASSFHATVFSQLKANGINSAVSSCCVPIQRRPLSMVYFNSQHSIVKTDVPDMIVESCGCT
ncbi:inhibin beta B chain-like [Salvelinus alpinus]|uniref:Inhibin beta B chain-like n=1 Tax=Salvelinus namaycush TaxID=8040 RepID=A0A8U1BSR6_SALNM|nr:inhibin beta B chain-like [Salvelinus namaycush]